VQRVSVIGSSGAGKSTVGRALALAIGGDFLDKSVIAWARQTYDSRRERYLAAMADPVNSHLRFVRLGSPAAVRRFLRQAVPASGGD
jgi:adenylate kinase family enzyme